MEDRLSPGELVRLLIGPNRGPPALFFLRVARTCRRSHIWTYRCCMRTEMDCLVVGDFLMFKAEQPPFEETEDWRKQHTLD